jgi:ATP-binding cassette, subfamily C (CFTR/MRP), member 1
MIFLPIVTFGFYVTYNISAFDVSRALTALSIISLMSMSLLDVVSNIPQLAAAATCFDRIQVFLTYDECDASGTRSRLKLKLYDQSDCGFNKASSSQEKGSRKQQKFLPWIPLPRALSADTIVKVINADFTGIQGQALILKDISFECRPGSLSAIVGPAGSGKTMLIQSLLGETVLVKGAVILNCKSIAFCGQESWLSNTTIQDNILFGCTYDYAWYHTVLHACLLDQNNFRYGDKTLVGSGGINLSGGQKQRVVSSQIADVKSLFTAHRSILNLRRPSSAGHVC